MVAGVPWRCMATHPAPVRAATGHREADTSLMSEAPACDGRLGHILLGGVDGDPDLAGQRLDDRQDPTQLLVDRHRIGPRPGRFTAHVDHIGPLFDQDPAPGDGPVAVGPQAAVGERVGGDVEDPHHQGALLCAARLGHRATA